MIFDVIKQLEWYAGLPIPQFQNILQFLKTTDLQKLKAGRIELDAENLIVLVQEYETKPFAQGKWEAHRVYIDLQYMLEGAENMGFANIDTLKTGVYHSEKDFQALEGDGNLITVNAGEFVIFFPQDAHKPGLCIEKPGPVKKVVFKIKIENQPGDDKS